MDVAIEESIDVGVVQGVADEGVGDTVLNGAQVDVRQRRLGHGGDDAGDAKLNVTCEVDSRRDRVLPAKRFV